MVAELLEICVIYRSKILFKVFRASSNRNIMNDKALRGHEPCRENLLEVEGVRIAPLTVCEIDERFRVSNDLHQQSLSNLLSRSRKPFRTLRGA